MSDHKPVSAEFVLRPHTESHNQKLLVRHSSIEDMHKRTITTSPSEYFKALAEKGINIRAITTSEIKISILIDGPYAELAVRTLHSVYGLDKQ